MTCNVQFPPGVEMEAIVDAILRHYVIGTIFKVPVVVDPRLAVDDWRIIKFE